MLSIPEYSLLPPKTHENTQKRFKNSFIQSQMKTSQIVTCLRQTKTWWWKTSQLNMVTYKDMLWDEKGHGDDSKLKRSETYESVCMCHCCPGTGVRWVLGYWYWSVISRPLKSNVPAGSTSATQAAWEHSTQRSRVKPADNITLDHTRAGKKKPSETLHLSFSETHVRTRTRTRTLVWIKHAGWLPDVFKARWVFSFCTVSQVRYNKN